MAVGLVTGAWVAMLAVAWQVAQCTATPPVLRVQAVAVEEVKVAWAVGSCRCVQYLHRMMRPCFLPTSPLTLVETKGAFIGHPYPTLHLVCPCYPLSELRPLPCSG